MAMEKDVASVIAELSSGTGSSLYGALIVLRTTLIKSKPSVTYLIKADCVNKLVALLKEDRTRRLQHAKTVDITLSILANLCCNEEVCEKVKECSGISAIADITLNSKQENIHNRGIRALANLSQHGENCEELMSLGVPTFVVSRLAETQVEDCKFTYCRAIRLFGQSRQRLKKLLESTQSVRAVACLLKESNRKLKFKALTTLHEFVVLRCCMNFAEQILAANILEELVGFANSEDEEMATTSIQVILKLCEQERLRPPLGAAGAISLLAELMTGERKDLDRVSVMNALCWCSKEAVNRHKLHGAGVLELFVSILDEKDETFGGGRFSVLYDRVISSLVNFLYNDECLARLVHLGLVNILMTHLKRACGVEWEVSELNEEVRLLSVATEQENEENFNGHNSTSTVNADSEEIFSKGLEVKANDPNSKSSAEAMGNGNMDTAAGIYDGEVEGISASCSSDSKCTRATGSRHTFSINSPTYQFEMSWNHEDYASGVTCKTFSSAPQGLFVGKSPSSAKENALMAPYSPLSASSSYYSPAQSSPGHSLPSSPFSGPSASPASSFNSPRSPAWSRMSQATSPSYSLQENSVGSFETENQNSCPSPNYHTAQFSPLPFPPCFATSSLPSSPAAGNFGARSPVFNSQLSFVDPEDRHYLDSPAAMDGTCVSEQFNSQLASQELSVASAPSAYSSAKFAVVPLSQETQSPVYSTSEDEDDAENTPEALTIPPVSANVGNNKDGKEDLSVEATVEGSSTEKDDQKRTLTSKLPFHKYASDSIVQNSFKRTCSGDNSSFSRFTVKRMKPELPSQGQNSDNIPKIDGLDLSKTNSDLEEDREQVVMKCKQSFPFTSKGKQLLRPKSSNFFFNSPGASTSFAPSPSSSSPFSRHGCSPYVSPNPYCSPFHDASTSRSSFGEKHSFLPSSKTDGPSLPKLNTSLNGERLLNPGCSNSSNSAASAPQQNMPHSIERLKKILRTTESNILILLSRLSVKTDPGPILANSVAVNSLLNYLAVSPNPFHRCVRVLQRLCSNPLCFEPLILAHTPIFIVSCLILNSARMFPQAMFTGASRSKLSDVFLAALNRDEVGSSQNSDAFGSQASEFGNKISFEFGGDAYSRMLSSAGRLPSIASLGEMFRDRPSLSVNSQSAMDSGSFGLNGALNSGAADSTQSQLLVGVDILRALTSVALSRYGDGEIQRIMARGLPQDRLTCAIGLLHMPLGCGPSGRRLLMDKYKLVDKVLPCLSIPESPLAREAIVTALSLFLHLCGTDRKTLEMNWLPPCPDSQRSTTEMNTLNLNESVSHKSDDNHCSKPVSNIDKSDTLVNQVCSTHLSDDCDKNTSDTPSQSHCLYLSMVDNFDIHLVVTETEEKVFGAKKDVVVQKSDFFAAMLSGSYAESEKSEIALRDTSVLGFEFVLHYLHGCTSGCSVIDSLLLKKQLDTDITDSDPRQAHSSDRDGTEHHLTSMSSKSSSCNNGGETQRLQGAHSETNARAFVSGAANASDNDTKKYVDSTLKSSTVSGGVEHRNRSEDAQIQDVNEGLASSRTDSHPEEDYFKQIDDIFDKCVHILSVADQFLLKDLTDYICSVLSYTCLHLNMCEDIFYLACFYHLEPLIMDCVTVMLTSATSRQSVAGLFLNLALNGHKTQAAKAVASLVEDSGKAKFCNAIRDL